MRPRAWLDYQTGFITCVRRTGMYGQQGPPPRLTSMRRPSMSALKGQCNPNSKLATAAEAAARGSLLRMTPRKWRLIRMFESIMRFLLPTLPSPRAGEKPNAEPASILVIEYWNLGDLAILVPFLKNLRRNFPSSRISLLVNEGLVSFLEGQEIVDEFIPVRVPWAQHLNRWRKYNPFSPRWISLTCTLLALRRRQFDLGFSGRMDIRDNFIL